MATVNQTFYWFDYETFGKDPKRDRPVQFGGLRTDSELNPIGKEDLLYCQVADDYLPDPEACLITGITPLTCMEKEEAMCEAAFAETINEQLSKPGTISVGYNNFRFDDNVTRFLFWRNLIDPYARERGENRSRFDLYYFVKVIFAFKNNTLKWPKNEEGKISLSLELLTKENNLVHDHAHDALSDTKATLALARLLKSKQPGLWDYALKMTNIEEFRNLLSQQTPLLYVNPYGDLEKRFFSLIFPLRPNPARKDREGKNKLDEWLCWDLNSDPQELPMIQSKDLKERFFVSRENREKGVIPLPLLKIRFNQNPFVVKAGPFMKDPKIQEILGITPDLFIQRATALRNKDLGFVDNIWAEINDNTNQRLAQDLEIETSLFGRRFTSDRDRQKLNILRKTKPEDLQEKVETMDFEDEELNDLVFRYRARNYPESLWDSDESNKWYNYRLEHLVDGKDGSRTFKQFFEELSKLEELHPDKEEILSELRDYAENLQQDLPTE